MIPELTTEERVGGREGPDHEVALLNLHRYLEEDEFGTGFPDGTVANVLRSAEARGVDVYDETGAPEGYWEVYRDIVGGQDDEYFGEPVQAE